MSGFQKAERKQVKLKLGLAGPSGSGKTFSALRIAKGLGDKTGKPYRIALVDSENKSASLYADSPGMPAFDTLELEPPYTIDKYIAAMELAIKEGYDFLIVDSVSHVWSGEGGILQEKEALDKRGGNSYANWASMTPKWNRFVSAILHSDVHMLCTMRSKQDYVLEANDKGKQAPKKVGMAPQVREGFEYELTLVLDMDMSHQAQASKDRTNLFDGKTWKPDEKTGAEIWAWLNSGKAVVPAAATAAAPVFPQAKIAQRSQAIAAALDPVRWPAGTVADYIGKAYGTAKIGELSEDQFTALLTVIKTMTSSQAKAKLSMATIAPGSKLSPADRALVEPQSSLDELESSG